MTASYKVRVTKDRLIFCAGHYLGFARITDTIRDAIRSAINRAIRHGVLGYDGSVIRREE